MDELVSFLKGMGAPTWAIVVAIVLVFLAKPVTLLVRYVLRRPTMAELLNRQQEELGRQQGAFFDRVERSAKAAIVEAQEARAAANKCAEQHRLCLLDNEELRERVTQLEAVQKLNTQFRENAGG
jgi:hypothetical protein